MILRLLIIIACMALCGCTIQNEECFSAGAGTAVSENKLVIYAAYPSTWVNTGVFIDTNSKAKAEIFGSVNLCSSTANTQNVLVDGGQCADGSTQDTLLYHIHMQEYCPWGALMVGLPPELR